MPTHRPSDDPARWIGRPFVVHVDRPLGSFHPRFPGLRYRVNYGFVPGTRAADGHPIDAYVLGPARPLRRFRGICRAILHRADDVEDKLVIALPGLPLDDAAIRAATPFQERFFQTTILR
ncbi:MAG: inorganic diphosphatase [Pseudomonadota bacterium]